MTKGEEVWYRDAVIARDAMSISNMEVCNEMVQGFGGVGVGGVGGECRTECGAGG